MMFTQKYIFNVKQLIGRYVLMYFMQNMGGIGCFALIYSEHLTSGKIVTLQKEQKSITVLRLMPANWMAAFNHNLNSKTYTHMH